LNDSFSFIGIVCIVPGVDFNAKPDQDFVFIRHVTNKAANRQRQLFDERGGGNDLAFACPFGLLKDVDDFQGVTAMKMFVAKNFHIQDRAI
jgi:hypothetical protein